MNFANDTAPIALVCSIHDVTTLGACHECEHDAFMALDERNRRMAESITLAEGFELTGTSTTPYVTVELVAGMVEVQVGRSCRTMTHAEAGELARFLVAASEAGADAS